MGSARGAYSIRPHASAGGGPPCAAGWWRGRGPRRFSFDESESVSQTPPPPSFARCASYGWSPSLAIAGAEGTTSRSRGAFFVRARVMQHAKPKTSPRSRPLPDDSGGGSAELITIRHGAERTEIKKEAERRQTRSQRPHLRVRRCPRPHPPGEDQGEGSSSDGVPPRHLRQRTNAAAQLQTHFLGRGGRMIRKSKKRSCATISGRYPPPPVPVQRHSRRPVMMPAGRCPEAAREQR